MSLPFQIKIHKNQGVYTLEQDGFTHHLKHATLENAVNNVGNVAVENANKFNKLLPPGTYQITCTCIHEDEHGDKIYEVISLIPPMISAPAKATFTIPFNA